MNPLVKKEIRLLLPSFLISVALAVLNCLLPDFGSSAGFRAVLIIFPFLLCPVMAVMMALDSFGAEVSAGTFSSLLEQPVPRARIWQIKIPLLAAALFIVGVVWCVSFYLRYAPFTNPQNPQDFWDVFVVAWMFLLVVFSGGLWTVLLLRQVAAAFWFTLLVPGAILVLTVSLAGNLSDEAFEEVAVTVLGIYTLAGFCFARWLFLRAQDTQWTGGTIAMPEMRGVSLRFAKSGLARRWRPHAALWWKETQLHQAQFIMAGVLAVLHLGVLATRKLGHFPVNSSTEFILESFWWLWLVMPLLVGCAAMAEERKLGTLDSQLCLPVKRRTQFRIKVLVVVMVSVALGVVMPWLLEGNKILPDFHLEKAVNEFYLGNDYYYFSTTAWGIVWLTLLNVLASASFSFLCMAAICAGVAVIAFYASTQARNTLQALAPAMLGLLLTWFLVVMAAQPYDFGLGFLWRGPLVYFIATPVMLVVLAALAYWNCQRVLVGWNVWWRNLLTLGVSLTLLTVATTAINHRAWELLTPIEPPHGIARWATANPPRMQINGQNITIYLPDGRIWLDGYDLYASNPFETKIIESRMFGGGKFLDGTNWTDVQDCWRDIIGIQRDGSLWVSEKRDNFYRFWLKRKMPVSESTKLARFGHDNDWKNVSGRFFNTPFLLKTDGTLWIWGTNKWDWRKDWPGLHAFTPQRLGTNSNWEKIFTANGRTFFFKTNGQVWVEPGNGENEVKTLGHGITISHAPYLENKKWKNIASIGRMNWAPFLVGVFEDGTFREIAAYERMPMTPEISKHIRTTSNFTFGLVSRDAQIGTETNWLALVENNWTTVTLKADGTLWEWNFSRHVRYHVDIFNPNKASATRLGTHSDWVAVGEMMNGIVALAADGSLWLWQSDEPAYYNYPGDVHSLLAPTRHPQLLGNIFGKAD